MVERFNGRVQREVLGITLYSHADLEIVLRGFNAAYNGHRQRVLSGLSPEMVLRQHLEADPAFASLTYKPPSPNLIKRALRIISDAKEVSHPDNQALLAAHARPLKQFDYRSPRVRTLKPRHPKRASPEGQ